jgi:hypothetical protein
MLRMCVYMYSRFIENHPIRILEDGPLISEVVLSHLLHSPLFSRVSGSSKRSLPTFSPLIVRLP